MPRRIDVELTSRRDDGSWTWRKAAARQPKGELQGSLLYEGAKVGDVVSAEADFDIEGITITAITPPKGARREPERIEIISAPLRDDQLVIETLAPKGGGRRDERGPRDERGSRDKRRGPRSSRGDRGSRPGGDRRPSRTDTNETTGTGSPARTERPARSDRPARKPKPVADARPKPKRLRAGRVHRNEVLNSLPEEQKPIAEAVLLGGIPAVRQAVEKQNEEARISGSPEITPDGVVSIAEQLLPRLRAAEWHDRADAAMADIDDLDLRDLRSVVVAADQASRDEVSRELAQNVRDALAGRVEKEQAAWLAEITQTLADGRTVRALRLSSRPPKAGSPLPVELATSLTEATNVALTADTSPDRYATVLDALAFSPVRLLVVAEGIPAVPGEPLLLAVRKIASRVPQIAILFGVEPPAARSSRSKGSKARSKPVPAPPEAQSVPPTDLAAPESAQPVEVVVEEPVEPVVELPVESVETDAIETAAVETAEPAPLGEQA